MPDHARDLARIETRLAWLAAAVSRPRISRSLGKQIHAELRWVQKKLTAIQAFVLAEPKPVKVKKAKHVKQAKVVRVEVQTEEGEWFDVEGYAERNII